MAGKKAIRRQPYATKQSYATKKDDGSPRFRARVTRSLSLIPGLDGRSLPARVFKDTYLTLVNHCGGEDNLPETLRLMCRRAAAIEAELINLEARFAQVRVEGKQPVPTDLDLYQRLTNTQRRVCEALGWRRTARDVTPSLGELLREGRHA